MEPVNYKPSAFYFRRRLRRENDPEVLRAVGFSVVAELERLKEWVRDQGLVPPKWSADPDEAKEKNWRRGT